MKKTVKKILAASCALACLFGLFACNEQTEKEIINAYDLAVQNGFTGTVEEWLLSLQGASGKDGADLDINEVYDAAVAEGYEGTFLEFLKEYLSVDVQENNDTQTIADNMTSVVSICASFKTTQTVQMGWPTFSQKTTVNYSGAEGSGVIIDINKDAGTATILTNYHVVYEAGSDGERDISDCIYIYPYGARERFSTGQYDMDGDGSITEADRGDIGGDGIKATFVGGAMAYDIAILEVSGSEYLKESCATEAKIGSSEDMAVGEKVFAVGNANGLGISVTSGILSVPSETITMSALDGSNTQQSFRVMRTDAGINHGNSGGALFNAKGELVGITNAKNVEDETDGLFYALPITQIQAVVENIQANNGIAKCAWLGITSTVTASKSVKNEHGTLDIVEEITVSEVIKTETSDGYKPGAGLDTLKVGDVILSVTIKGETHEITRSYHLTDLLLRVREGDTISLKVLRDGTETNVNITFDSADFYERG
ncbi:MAG: trypsin-like peptidase domain-containing protein [Clostridia bacterium]|nr:trypsin-like peptidase domain-containing protein [Clostridia bacterium]